MAGEMPDALAIVEQHPLRRGRREYRRFTFRELDQDSDRIARGLRQMGVRPGDRLVLMVRPSFDFISLVFALFKAGAVAVLIDPGMGIRGVLGCLDEVAPAGFVAIPPVQAVRTLLRRRFAAVRQNVTVGARWFWGGPSLADFRKSSWAGHEMAGASADDPAAIIFTSGSTGPAKGVLYRHGNFERQVDEIRDFYQIAPGEVDLPCFPLFALFNCAMGVTAVIPDMDATRPARVDPDTIIAAAADFNATQSFGSPAVWNRIGRHCEANQVRLPTLRRVLSAGAPVPPRVMEWMMRAIADGGEMHTPYGATEALPVASIAASEVLGETAAQSAGGAGTCVGRKFPGIEWRVVRVDDGPIGSIDDAQPLPAGEVGELVVKGPVVTREYVTRVEANPLAKIADGEAVWHRMGDLGYLDDQERFWFCGRKAHRVDTAAGTMYSVPCEAILNNHAEVYRSALVGVGERGRQRPVAIVEPEQGHWPRGAAERNRLLAEVRRLAVENARTAAIDDFLLHRSLPVDIRHNAKIFREKLAVWAAPRVD
ncbi:MAG: AMP-binding protein [Planctomycetales bacterium]|nr:AMP-binding protein [Planctomycetales bacterium]